MYRSLTLIAATLLANCCFAGQKTDPFPISGDFKWHTGNPILKSAESYHEDWIALKDPTVIRYGDRWHGFCTVRGRKRSHSITYFSFDAFENAAAASQQELPCHKGFFCAPQVFYFTPQQQWYLICQASNDSWNPKYQAAYTTTRDISDANSWAALQPLGAKRVDGKAGLDFWVICDEEKAYLFITTLDGRMWREETPLAAFPHGWSEGVLALRADVFEASHTYKVVDADAFMTVIEAQGSEGRRYFKAYVSDRLDGEWTPLAATRNRAFASAHGEGNNVRQTGGHWTDMISHGELIRAGFDQRLELNPTDLKFIFQGVLSQDRKGKSYGEIPWRLGLLQDDR